jgi:hypothetical protein
MADLVLIALTFGFTVLCVAYIAWCDRIIGPDDFGADIPASPVALDVARTTEAAGVSS